MLFGVLGSRCCTRPPLLDCHVLKGFGIYMIGILGRLYGCMEESQLASPVCSSLDNITRVLSQPSFSFFL